MKFHFTRRAALAMLDDAIYRVTEYEYVDDMIRKKAVEVFEWSVRERERISSLGWFTRWMLDDRLPPEIPSVEHLINPALREQIDWSLFSQYNNNTFKYVKQYAEDQITTLHNLFRQIENAEDVSMVVFESKTIELLDWIERWSLEHRHASADERLEALCAANEDEEPDE